MARAKKPKIGVKRLRSGGRTAFYIDGEYAWAGLTREYPTRWIMGFDHRPPLFEVSDPVVVGLLLPLWLTQETVPTTITGTMTASTIQTAPSAPPRFL